MQKKQNNKLNKKIFNGVVLLIAVEILAIIALAIVFITRTPDESDPSSSLPSSSEEVQQEQPVSSVASLAQEELKEDEIDFDELIKINSDTIGYLKIPGTVIDYPVVRGVDNIKYLTTNFEGEYDVLGTVFADMFNGDNLLSPVTVLYGHYDPSGNFFTQLHRYRDSFYFENNPEIYLSTPTADYTYEIIAAFENDNYSLMYEKDYNDKTQLQGFIDKMANIPDPNANLNLESVSTDDTFLALSTCLSVGDSPEKRYVVVAKLVE